MKTPRFLTAGFKSIKNRKKEAGYRGAIEVIATAVGIFIVSQLLAAVIMGVFLGAIDGSAAIDEQLKKAPAQFAYVLLAEAAAIGLVFWVLKLKRLTKASIGLGRRPRWSDLGSGLLGFLAYYALVVVLLALISWLIPSININQPQDVGFDKLNGPGDRAFAFASLVLLAPIGEEILMRGYLYSGLRSKLKYVPAMLITSVIFGAAHLEFGNNTPLVWAAALSTFILSIVLVYKREKTGALYAGILIHVLNNLVAFIVKF